MLALLESERARAATALGSDLRLLYGIWGVAWLVGFLTRWSGTGRGPVHVPGPLAVGVFNVCIAGAVVLTIAHHVRRSAGVRGPSVRSGAMYGWAWFWVFGALGAVMSSLYAAGLDEERITLLWSVLSGVAVGTLYLGSAAIARDWVEYGIGAWVLVVSAVASFAGYPGVFLVMGLAGGGGFLLAALWFTLRPVPSRWVGGAA
jgi:hypothetical protein